MLNPVVQRTMVRTLAQVCVSINGEREQGMDGVLAWFDRIEDVAAFRAIRQGLVLTIPVLLVGSFCLILLNLPVPAYQDALAQAPWISAALTVAYNATMGVFSMYVAVSIALCYANAFAERNRAVFAAAAPFAALGVYLIFVGFGIEIVPLKVLSTRSLFVAIIAGLVSSMLYCRIAARMPARHRYGDNADVVFNKAVSALVPIGLVLAGAAALNATVSLLFGVTSVEESLYEGVSALYPQTEATFASGLFYLFVNNVMWFFGIHGGNMLDGVAQTVFVPGTALNAAAVAAGEGSVQIVTKTFLDVFASIGGAGALLSLLVAVVLFARRRNLRRLAAFSAAPMVFNISEIMMFGLPVVWNPALAVPFIVVPLVNMTVAYLAMALGLVPPVTVDVSWITPPVVGGYVATGSWTGAVLQLVNIALGVVIYLPFLRRYERLADRRARDEYARLLDAFREAEAEQREIDLASLPGATGALAASLAADVRLVVERREIALHYQPQFNAAGRAVGAEALLRFEHPDYGSLYPPLMLALAQHAGVLEELERVVFDRALNDAKRIEQLAHEGVLDAHFTVSVNATARMLQDEHDVEFILAAVRTRGLDAGRVVVEATEREALRWDAQAEELLERLCDAGIPLAIDDFSMGRTSFQYLETSVFSVVKLDGVIAKGVMGNKRYAEIVSSIADLSERLGFTVLAEYVETPEQRDRLRELGCSYFQGYLYAPALPFDELVERVRVDGRTL